MIRRAALNDRDMVAGLWMQLLEEMAAIDPLFSADENARERWLNDFKEWVPAETRRIFVAEREGSIAGYISAHPWFPPPIHASTQEVYISELYVVAGARGKGIGSDLVDAVKGWAIEIEAARLRAGILAANEPARSFWAKQGGRDIAVTSVIDLPPAASV